VAFFHNDAERIPDEAQRAAMRRLVSTMLESGTRGFGEFLLFFLVFVSLTYVREFGGRRDAGD
jgi:hypothetical protein